MHDNILLEIYSAEDTLHSKFNNFPYNLLIILNKTSLSSSVKAQMQYRSDAEQDISRTGWMQDRPDAGQARCRTGPIQDRMDAGTDG